MTALDLARLVAELRGKQKAYYWLRVQSGRQVDAKTCLADCKRLEANLDRVVEGILTEQSQCCQG